MSHLFPAMFLQLGSLQLFQEGIQRAFLIDHMLSYLRAGRAIFSAHYHVC